MSDMMPRRLRLLEHYADGEDARHFSFCIDLPRESDLSAIPGQFFMLAIPGFGEAPFTYVTPPGRNGCFVALIRRVGKLTEALFEQENGAVLGYRGPFGKGWPLLIGSKRVLAVAGGCGLAPLAGLIQECITHRLPMQLSVIYGARHMGAQLLRCEREQWRRSLPFIETLDQAAEGMRQGTPLQHLEEMFGNAPPDAVLCCGPEALMLAIAEQCLQRGLAERQIWLSLERRMHCTEGRCGHCYLGASYVCRDGPTYRYDRFLELQRHYVAKSARQSLDYC